MQAAWQYWILCIYIYCSIYGSARLHFINPRISKVWHIPYLYNSSNIYLVAVFCVSFDYFLHFCFPRYRLHLLSALSFSSSASQFLFFISLPLNFSYSSSSPQPVSFSSSSPQPVSFSSSPQSVSPLPLHLSLSVSLLHLPPSHFPLFLFTSVYQFLFFFTSHHPLTSSFFFIVFLLTSAAPYLPFFFFTSHQPVSFLVYSFYYNP